MYDEPNPSSPTLSPAGRRRKGTILELARREAGRRKTRRVRRVAAGGAMTALLLSTVIWLAFRERSSPSPLVVADPPAAKTPHAPDVAAPPAPSVAPAAAPAVYVVRRRQSEIRVTAIPTDPTLADKWAAPHADELGGIQRADDAALQKALGSAGLSGGVIVRGGKPDLWWQPTALRDSRTSIAKRGGI